MNDLFDFNFSGIVGRIEIPFGECPVRLIFTDSECVGLSEARVIRLDEGAIALPFHAEVVGFFINTEHHQEGRQEEGGQEGGDTPGGMVAAIEEEDSPDEVRRIPNSLGNLGDGSIFLEDERIDTFLFALDLRQEVRIGLSALQLLEVGDTLFVIGDLIPQEAVDFLCFAGYFRRFIVLEFTAERVKTAKGIREGEMFDGFGEDDGDKEDKRDASEEGKACCVEVLFIPGHRQHIFEEGSQEEEESIADGERNKDGQGDGSEPAIE